MKTKSPAAEGLGDSPCSELVVTFHLEGGGKTIDGTMTVPDDDGTSHLPMLMHGMLKQCAESVPEICKATSLTISAYIHSPNDQIHPR